MNWHHYLALCVALTCLSPTVANAQSKQEPNSVRVNIDAEIAKGRIRQDGSWIDLEKQGERSQWSTSLTIQNEPWFLSASLEVSFSGTNRHYSVPLRLSPGTTKIDLSLLKPTGLGCHQDNVYQLEKTPMASLDEALKVFGEAREYYSYWPSGNCSLDLLHRVAFMWLLSSYEIAKRYDFIGLDKGAIDAVRTTAKSAQADKFIGDVESFEAAAAYRWSAKYLQTGQLDRGCALNQWIEKNYSGPTLQRASISKDRLKVDRDTYGCQTAVASTESGPRSSTSK